MFAQQLTLSLSRFRLADESCYVTASTHSHPFSSTLPDEMIPLSIPSESELGFDEDSEFENERKNSFGSIPRPFRARDGADVSPPSSPAGPDDVDRESLAFQHPHATSPINTYADQAVRRDTESPTPSLVPTEPASRSPSPSPHPCVAELERQGIKVRDFAFEEHAVPLARVVPDVELLKTRYELYRSANLTPPPEIVEGLNEYDQLWLDEKKAFYDNRQLMSYAMDVIPPRPGWRG